MPDFSLQITASAVAWYAAVVATFSLAVSAYNAWKDRARITIKYTKGWLVVGGDPYYQADVTYYGVTVINKGQRTVAIGNVGIKLLDGTALLLAESINGRRNKVLTEQNPKVEFLTPQADLPFDLFYRIEVYDEAGGKYFKYFSYTPTLTKFFYWISKI